MTEHQGFTKDFLDTLLADPVAWWRSTADSRDLNTWMRIRTWMLRQGWVCEPGARRSLPWRLRRVKKDASALFARRATDGSNL